MLIGKFTSVKGRQSYYWSHAQVMLCSISGRDIAGHLIMLWRPQPSNIGLPPSSCLLWSYLTPDAVELVQRPGRAADDLWWKWITSQLTWHLTPKTTFTRGHVSILSTRKEAQLTKSSLPSLFWSCLNSTEELLQLAGKSKEQRAVRERQKVALGRAIHLIILRQQLKLRSWNS